MYWSGTYISAHVPRICLIITENRVKNVEWNVPVARFLLEINWTSENGSFYLKRGCIQIRDGNKRQVILEGINKGWDGCFEGFNGFPNDLLMYVFEPEGEGTMMKEQHKQGSKELEDFHQHDDCRGDEYFSRQCFGVPN